MILEVKRTLGALVLSGACTFTILSGCAEAGEELALAIGKARHQMVSVSPGSSASVPDEMRERIYTEVIGTLQSKMGQGSDGSKAAAALIIADAQLGKAQIAGSRARSGDSQLAFAMNDIRALLQLRSGFLAQSAAKSALKWQQELSNLDSRISELDASLITAELRLTELQTRGQELQAMADKRRENAVKMRELENEIRRRAIDTDAQARARLIEEANTYRRQGDEHEREAGLILADLGRLTPDILAQRSEVEKMKLQRKLFLDSREGLQARQTEAEAAAQADLQRAADVGREIITKVDSLRTRLQDEVLARYEEALQAIEAGETSVSKARSGSTRDAAQAEAGALAHAKALILLDRRYAALRAADLLDAVVSGTPPVSQSSTYTTLKADMLKLAEESATAAGQAYVEARTAFEGMRVAGDGQERLAAVMQRMAEIEAHFTGQPPPSNEGTSDPEPEPEPEETPQADDSAG